MGRDDFTPNKYSRLCSRHFKEEDIDRTSVSCVRLRSGAVPSIFDASDYLKENVASKRPPRKRIFSKHDSDSERAHHSPEVPGKSTETGCLKSENEGPKHNFNSVKDELAASRKNRKVLCETKRRLKRRNCDLESVITELKKKCYMSEDKLC